MAYASLLLVLIASIIFCFDRNAHAIINGQYAELGTYTYHVAVNKTTVGNNCGGALINPIFVLTAAHCVYDAATANIFDKPMLVQAGCNKLAKPGSVRLVEVIYVPKQFSLKNDDADIAVLQLRYPFDLNNEWYKVSLAKLPIGLPDYTDKTGVITGFGLEYLKTHHWIHGPMNFVKEYYRNGFLKVANVNIVPSKKYQSFYTENALLCIPIKKPWRTVDDRFLCAKMEMELEVDYLKRGTCLGDSGGPLVIDNNVVIGILKHSGVKCDERTRPSLYVRVYHYLDFIKSAMNDYNNQGISRYECDIQGFRNNPEYNYLQNYF